MNFLAPAALGLAALAVLQCSSPDPSSDLVELVQPGAASAGSISECGRLLRVQGRDIVVNTCNTCQEIASPSRSGSVARMSLSAPLTASAIALTCFCDFASTSQVMAKSCSGSTEPFFEGRSRTWP